MAETDSSLHITTGNNNQKIIRAPTLKRGKEETSLSNRVKLERVLGLTVSSNSGLDCDPNTQLIAYPAGCAIVLFNPVKNKQSHLLNTSRKTVSSVCFSPDGKYLASGECGHVPSVRIWDLSEGTQIAEFPGHKYGINCLAFSPSQKYVVSVGSQHDMIVNVWDWKSGVKIASNKVSTKVKAIAFSENGKYFVTVGNRHVKFWYLEYSRSAKFKELVPLMGRSAILGEQRNNDFCDVACGRGCTGDSTYAVTKSGLLCEFNNRRLLDKWVELRTTSANCMAIGENHIFIGCAEGIVRCFNPSTLHFITTLPRTHYLGVDVAQGLNISHMASHPKNAKYPDAIALAFDEISGKLSCIYNDHSLYVWDIRDIQKVGKAHSFLYHSACIWGVEMFPSMNDNTSIPSGSFLTCSSDDTIRVWNLDFTDFQENNSLYRRNIYSNELLKVLYVDPDFTYLKDIDINNTERSDNTPYDSRNGVRSIRISPDGKHLASGDRAGNIRIHDVHSLEELCLIEAHDAEVLCLEYSRFENNEKNLLASASRDRLIHIFNVNEEYKFVQTLDDHSSSITSVRFLNTNNQMHMVSCGADKSIIFRHLQSNQFTRGQNAAGKTTLYDMEVDYTQKHVLTACQDRNIRVYSVNNGKHTKTFKGSVGEDGSLIKITLDASGILVATSSTDKTLCIYDYYSGECLATMLGHSELATGLRFTNDCTRLISASGDGCIFVWKVPHDLVVTMHARLSQQAARAGKKLNGIGIYSAHNEIFGQTNVDALDPNANSVPDNDYRFSVGPLPLWAKKQISEKDVPAFEAPRILERPKGRWAQRLDPSDKRLDSDGSKEDSSIDSGTETSRSLFHQEIKRETMILSNKQIDTSKVTLTRDTELLRPLQNRSRHLTDDSSLGSFKYEDMESTEHDGDVEDYSEGESTEAEPRHQLIYYPAAEDSHSDYTVNAMDVEELRRSQRRKKTLDLLVPGETSQSVSGSQESEDDEQASTPSGENSERNIINALSASSESIDVISSRDSFFKNTFESLSGNEVEKETPSKKGNRSISSQHLGNGPRNSIVIQAAIHSKNDAETTKKRRELQRRIEETRRQLKSVGYRSNLKTSQSTQDLSPRGKGFHDSKLSKQVHQQSNAGVLAHSLVDEENSPGGIRRACSLSDLANPTSLNKQHQLHANHLQGTTKSTSNRSGSRTVSRYSMNKPASTTTRSISVDALNQSDSESDLSHQHTGSLTRTNRLMRATISSQNKSVPTIVKTTPSGSRKRMCSSYSTMSLNQVGDNEDSSSEEGKNNPVGRSRNVNQDRSNAALMGPPPRRTNNTLGRSGSERDLSHFQRMSQRPGTKIQRSNSGYIKTVSGPDGNTPEFHTKDGGNTVDVSSAPLSQQLISSITDQLMHAIDSVVQLHKRLEIEAVNQSDHDVLLTDLHGAVEEAQKSLRLVEPISDINVANKIQEVLTKSNDPRGNIESFFSQYSDVIASLVQQKMSNENKN